MSTCVNTHLSQYGGLAVGHEDEQERYFEEKRLYALQIESTDACHRAASTATPVRRLRRRAASRRRKFGACWTTQSRWRFGQLIGWAVTLSFGPTGTS